MKTIQHLLCALLLGLLAFSAVSSALALNVTYNAATDVGATAGSYTASGTVNFTLNFAPPTGANLTVVKNTGLGFINGTFSNLAQGQAVALTFNGVTYNFVANYFGGTGNDLVLVWANNRAMAWGYNAFGQLGNNSTTNSSVPVAVTSSGILSGKTVVAAAAGYDHSVALCSDGTVAAWGGNGAGELGNNSTTDSYVPVAVNRTGVLSGKTVVAVAAGQGHSVALCSDGTVATWGLNVAGQLGNNSTTDSYVPVAVNRTGVLSGKTVVSVSAGLYYSVALCSDGTVATWGQNDHGQLGNNSTADSYVPVAVNSAGVLSGKTVVAVAGGGLHSIALCSDGTLAAWGLNDRGQLGNNSTTDSPVPVAVNSAGVLSGRTVVAVAAGEDHSLALCSDGTVAAWGYNISGQLGNNSMTDSMVPVLVNSAGVLSGKTVVAVAAGGFHSMALCSDGTLAAWGGNGAGQLGENSTTDRKLPWAVNTAALSVGERFVLANGGSLAAHSLAIVATPPPPSPPTVTVLAAGAITTTTATLNGTVNPNGLATTAQFEYGLSTSYGTTASVSLSPNNGSTAQNVTANLTGLTKGVTYHYRLTGTNSEGTAVTADGIFTTPGPGSLDLTFGTGGIVATPVGSSNDGAQGVVVQPDGKILAAGFSYNGTNNDIAVCRYNANGSVDTSFGGGTGKVTTAIGTDTDLGYAIALQSDGKIVVAGVCSPTPADAYDFAVVRYNSNGTLDTTFNGTGKVTTPIGGGDDIARSVAIQSDGKIVVAGNSSNGSNNDFAVVRYNANGTLDTTFNGTGKVTTPIGTGHDVGHAVMVQGDGKIVVAGASFNAGSDYDFALVRFTASGTLDASFGTGGKVITAIGSGDDEANGVVLQADGKIVAVGSSNNGSSYDTELVRYNANGTLDTTFNGTGKVTTPIVAGNDEANSVVLQADGKLVVAGYAGTSPNSDFAVLRYNANGTLDTTFYGTGIAITAVGSGNDVACGVALQSDGNIVVAGFSSNGSNTDFALVRYLGNPLPVLTLGAATSVAGTTATLNGTVNPNGLASTAQFEYGLTTSYGSTASVTLSPNNSSTAQNVSTNLTGLSSFTTYHYRLTATNSEGTAVTSDGTFTTLGSNDATLSNLALGSGTLTPSFASGTLSYTASVAHSTTSITITPAVTESHATVKVNNVTVASGSPSGAISLAVGDNVISTVVTAQDGTTTQTYTVTVTRAPLTWTYNAATDVPLTAGSYTAAGAVTLSLNFAPPTGTNLTVVKNTGLGFISGTFSNLAQGQAVALTYNGVTYNFVANYYGGTGNDLVLVWKDNRAMAWGLNDYGQIGNNNTTPSNVPVVVASAGVLSGKTVIAVAGGALHSVALCSDGTLAAWGRNSEGQLGNNSTTLSLVPVAVNTTGVLSGKTIIAVAAAGHHSLALCSDGTLAAWGWNDSGQLGNNSTTNSSVPVVVNTAGVLSGKTVIAVAAGERHNLALCSDGTLAAWGRNSEGQLGNNSTTLSLVPVAVNTAGVLSGKTIIAVVSCGFHNLALCSDGTVATWGNNSSGQLGNNSTTDSLVPVAVNTGGVLSGKTVTAVASGYRHSLALCSDGTVAAWGSNFFGQLGNNSWTDSLEPVAVNPAGVLFGKTVISLAAAFHSLALCSDGAVVAWGNNSNGQLGNNSTTISSAPVAVSTAALMAGERFVSTKSGYYHSLGIVATPPPPPTATTLAATSITGTSATLNGTVNANNSSTAVSFDYGTSLSYGTNVNGTPTPVTGSSATAVSTTLSGLTPGTTYHFRVNGVSGAGTGNGTDLTFTTLSNDASLNNLTLSSGSLTPTFASGTLSYTASVSNSTSSFTVTPTATESHATITVNGVAVTSGNASGVMTLSVGPNLLNTVVTAQDGTTTQTYALTVTRQSAIESWRQLYFGTTANAGSAADTADPDGDGHNNAFEFATGLVPNDPASRFAVRVATVVGQPGQKAIIFSPLVAGRTYTVKSKASLTGGTWTPLTSFTTSDNGTERTVTDLSAGAGAKFYTVEITLP